MDEFIVRALIGGLMVAAVAGPLGSFVVWRRMAYFGDTLAHSALLGVALGFLIGISTNITVIVLCVALALLLVLLQGQRRLASDTLLGILAHSSLSLGLVVLSFMEGLRVDLFAYLFGDILAVTWGDVGWMLIGGSVALVLLLLLWRPLLALTVHEDLARVEGQPAQWISLGFMLLIALVIAVAMKVVGILLITSLLIIPAATARRFARTPEQMGLIAAILGMLAVLGGIGGSLHWDTPTGPSIVVAAAALFAAISLIPRRD
ncbi:zinc transport system permease protein [Ectothiorhodosinus mongolicus]|uniref:High-affinity zinc uptake system membrane protein ZnuB n=1 Tax=Ectothiorhodosinus mongolicus TaxID=233100 RepID=A0A1R3W389_9GAMM|nr:zinc ABC transporter permease subunit ZnuB [Ectothiorhodosinus mongolicus]ULX57432.1 zinc ABC transporter permease [Ectothiorhodosinus mongolicus]SIT72156.1 zinc transport system permease protein [Ectothiorhodosinus mongolicus]